MPTLRVGIFYWQPMNRNDYFKIGYISKTHGLRGEVTAIFEEEIERDAISVLFTDLRGSLVPYSIEKISGTDEKAFIKLEGIQTVEQARELKGCSIYTIKTVRQKLSRGDFYDDEVAGYSVNDNHLGLLGKVKEIQRLGINRLLLISGIAKEILIPVNAPFIKKINKAKKLIEVELPEGFLDF